MNNATSAGALRAFIYILCGQRGPSVCVGVCVWGGVLSEEQRPSLSMMFRNVCNCWLLLSATLPSVSFGTRGKLEQSGASVQTNWV